MTSHELCRFIINKHCKSPINWPREIKIAKKLISHVPEESFWEEFYLGFKVNTLAYLLTGSGKNDLGMAVGAFKLANPVVETYNAENTGESKIGADKIIKQSRRPKTVMDFFKE